MKLISVNRLSLDQHNRLVEAGYEINYVSNTPNKTPFVSYRYGRCQVLVPKWRMPKIVREERKLDVCNKPHIKEES